MLKTDAKGYVVDPKSNAILNNDEQAWIRYQAERDQVLRLKTLEEQVAVLAKRVMQLEKIIEENSK